MSGTRPVDVIVMWALRLLAVMTLVTGSAAGLSPAMASENALVQFLLIVDDSASMSKTVRGEAAADPDRLAVFAVQSLVTMLDDQDEFGLIRLNGDDSLPIEALATSRSRVADYLKLNGSLAAYAGQRTPCADALTRAHAMLQEAHRPGVRQVALFLTDGVCNSGALPDSDGWVADLNSHQEGLFQLHFLRFKGRNFSRGLGDLAAASGGESHQVSAKDPTTIIQPFSTAISRAQGYSAEVLKPGQARVEAHVGARRVRLLAVAPDGGSDLKLGFRPLAKGKPPRSTSRPLVGRHQYEDGRAYRYAYLDYQPGDVPVEVTVDGVGRTWKVVVVPEYRIRVVTDVLAGACAAATQDSIGVGTVDIGSPVCARIRLLNETGVDITEFVAGQGSVARFDYRGPTDDKARTLDAAWNEGAKSFMLERGALDGGDHAFRPSVQLRLDGGSSPPLFGGGRTVQALSRAAIAEPNQFDFGPMAPGSVVRRQFRMSGNFGEATAQFRVTNQDQLPPCLRVSVNDVEPGGTLTLTAGQSYALSVDIAPYCGATHVTRDLSLGLVFDFDTGPEGERYPPLMLPLAMGLDSDFSVDDGVDIAVSGGESTTGIVRIATNAERPATFDVVVEPLDERVAWSAGRKLNITVPETVTLQPGDNELAIEATAKVCCASGQNEAKMLLVPRDGGAKPLEVPVRITATYAGLLSCWGPTILAIVLALAAAYALLRLYVAWTRIQFIRTKSLSVGFAPLIWDDELYEAVPLGKRAREDRAQTSRKRVVRAASSFVGRLRQLMRARPWELLLPWSNRTFRQSLKIVLPTRLRGEVQVEAPSDGLTGEEVSAYQADPGSSDLSPGLYLIAPGSLVVVYPAKPGRIVGVNLVVENKTDDFINFDGDQKAWNRLRQKASTWSARYPLVRPDPSNNSDDELIGWERYN